MRKYGKLFTSQEIAELRSQFSFVDTDKNGNHRLFFDNAGGSLRLKKAEEAFKKTDELPDASEHANELALELLDIENKGRDDIRTIFGTPKGAIATGYTASQLMMEAVRIMSENAKGTNCVTSSLEHPSSFDAMTMYAQKYNRELRVVPANRSTGNIDTDDVLNRVDKNTAILSIMSASNISGHIIDIHTIALEARKINPDIIIISDAVQHAPHGVLNPEESGIDVMNFAPYKFFGIRGFGLMYLSDRVKNFEHHKLLGKPSDDWEIGSPATAHFAAMSAIVDYVCQIGTWNAPSERDRRQLFISGMHKIAAHEQALLDILVNGTEKVPGLRNIKGVTVKMDDTDLSQRDLITGFEFNNMDASQGRTELEKRGMIAFERIASSIYSHRMLEQFNSPGVVRISPLHVNTAAEMEEFLFAVKDVAAL